MKLPNLCRQKRRSGDLAYVEIEGHRIYCGDWGTPEAKEKYERIISEWLTTKQIPESKKNFVTVRLYV